MASHSGKITLSAVARMEAGDELRDAELIALIEQARRKPFVKLFGARKMWLHLRQLGHDVARCTV